MGDTKEPAAGHIGLLAEFAAWTRSEYPHMGCLYSEADARKACRSGWPQVRRRAPAGSLDATGFHCHIGAEGRPKMRFFLAPERFDP